PAGPLAAIASDTVSPSALVWSPGEVTVGGVALVWVQENVGPVQVNVLLSSLMSRTALLGVPSVAPLGFDRVRLTVSGLDSLANLSSRMGTWKLAMVCPGLKVRIPDVAP